MQIATATRTPAPTAIAPGTVLADATRPDGRVIQITAGRTLRTGVTDIAATGRELIQATHGRPGEDRGPTTWGTVGFFRTGDTWTAVELLEPAAPGASPTVLWSPFHVTIVRIAPTLQLDSLWQVSHYGGDYTRMAEHWFSSPFL